ncbi:hypothetical protein [Pseudomonas fluorescens]|uniref:hypothetical protein n=1 Tax=Pseudomonas fluorescens TaxID=294 RepID=UPI0012D2F309|nr:hypothetical protein [Pseudomonas fluorescens]
MATLRRKTPGELNPFLLGATPCCLGFYQQAPTARLTGAGSVYLVHLVAGASLEIATTGTRPDTGTSRISTWEFDATSLGNINVTLEGNKLKIGTCTVWLVDYDPEKTFADRVRFITATGVIKVVDPALRTICFDGFDGRFFEAPDAALATLPHAFASFADKVVSVQYMGLGDSTKPVKYSFPGRHWLAGDDVIDFAQLTVLSRCSHRIPERFPLPSV